MVLFTMFSVCYSIIYYVQCVLWYYLQCSVFVMVLIYYVQCVMVLFTMFNVC